MKNKKNGLIEEGFKYQCERCVKVFDCVVSLEAHRSNEHVATFCCKECGQVGLQAKSSVGLLRTLWACTLTCYMRHAA